MHIPFYMIYDRLTHAFLWKSCQIVNNKHNDMSTNCQQNNEGFKKMMLLHSGLLFVAIPLGL